MYSSPGLNVHPFTIHEQASTTGVVNLTQDSVSVFKVTTPIESIGFDTLSLIYLAYLNITHLAYLNIYQGITSQ